jgi:tetratricopeptide (TPR) repeat protein
MSHGLAEISMDLLTDIPTPCWYRLAAKAAPVEGHDYQCDAEIVLHTGGAASEAVSLAQQAVAIQADSGAFRATLAEAYLAAGSEETASREAQTAVFLGTSRGNLVLGKIEAQAGNVLQAVTYLSKGGPITVQWQGWDVAVYGRLGNLRFLDFSQFDAPGPTRYDFAAWLALLDLYQQQGSLDDAAVVHDAILALDPYFVFKP